MKIIYVTPYQASAVGNGGAHRTYQIMHDLRKYFGEDKVVELNYLKWQQGAYDDSITVKKTLVRGLVRQRFFRRLVTFYQNPLKIFWNNRRFSLYRYIYPEFIDLYLSKIDALEPAVCIIDSAGFGAIVGINRRRNIPTICLPQNFDALDTAPPLTQLPDAGHYSVLKDFSDELLLYKKCAHVLSISKIETGFLTGTGIKASYYPYLPVGEIKADLLKIREARKNAAISPDMFLMVGSASHASTREGMIWFLTHLKKSGLNSKIRLIVAGGQTDALGKDFPDMNIEFKGFIDQEGLIRLMIETRAMIIPQLRGFGALTRLSELSCAGIPVVCSEHAGYAVHLPPGIELVDNEWKNWEASIFTLYQESPRQNNITEYENWESYQPNPLKKIILTSV